MALSPEPTPVGRQQTKSAEARRRICEATIDCLAEFGYHGTSTTRIVERAGVSRGALQHHFPSKHDVIVAAAEHLLRRVIGSTERKARVLEAGPEGFAEFVRFLWRRMFDTHRYNAVLELLVAARTDPALKARFAPTIAQVNALLDARLGRLGQVKGADADEAGLFLMMTRYLMRGMALELSEPGVEPPLDPHLLVERWIALIGPHQ